jgi:hypothetical protein
VQQNRCRGFEQQGEGLWRWFENGYRAAPNWELAYPMREKPSPPALSPGDFVRHPGRPDWGLGQIQSMIGHRITVNFENAGKVVIDGRVVGLEPAEPPRP